VDDEKAHQRRKAFKKAFTLPEGPETVEITKPLLVYLRSLENKKIKDEQYGRYENGLASAPHTPKTTGLRS